MFLGKEVKQVGSRELVYSYYRQLRNNDFPHAGSIQRPSMLLDSFTEGASLCAEANKNRLQLSAKFINNVLADVRYKCNCDATAWVAVEILCDLVKDMPLSQLPHLGTDSFVEQLGGYDERFCTYVQGLLQMFKAGCVRYGTDSREADIDAMDASKRASVTSGDGSTTVPRSEFTRHP